MLKKRNYSNGCNFLDYHRSGAHDANLTFLPLEDVSQWVEEEGGTWAAREEEEKRI